ncbi:unnamed protein product [Ixodes hexagonus]
MSRRTALSPPPAGGPFPKLSSEEVLPQTTSGPSSPRRWELYQPEPPPRPPALPSTLQHALRKQGGLSSRPHFMKDQHEKMFQPVCCSRRSRPRCDCDIPQSQDSDSEIYYGHQIIYEPRSEEDSRDVNERHRDHGYRPGYDARDGCMARNYYEPESDYGCPVDYKRRVTCDPRDCYVPCSKDEQPRPQMRRPSPDYEPRAVRKRRSEHTVPSRGKSAKELSTEEVARQAWAKYEKEFNRYQIALAEWDRQQESIRKKLGVARSTRNHVVEEAMGAFRPPGSKHSLDAMDPKLANEPKTIRIGLSGNQVHMIGPQETLSDRLASQFTRMSLNDHGQYQTVPRLE